MKIAYNALSTQRNMTGSCRYYRNLIRWILQLKPDWTIDNWVNEQNRINYGFQSSGYQEHILGNWAVNRNLRIVYEQTCLGKEMNQVKPDLFHGNGFIPGGIKCPSVVTIHDMSYFRQPERSTFLRGWYFRKFNRIAILQSKLIITDSHASESDIIHFVPEAKGRVRVIPIALEPVFQPAFNETNLKELRDRYNLKIPFFLYLGTLEPGKNLVRLIKAYQSALAEAKLEENLVLAGKKGWLYDEIFKAVESTGLEGNRIFFLDYVPEEELPILYSAAECLVYPSLNEGFGLPPLEAMGCGTPVITSSVSSLPEVVGDAALTVNPLDEQALAQAMIQVAKDDNLKKSLREKGLKRAQLFSWDKIIPQVIQVYEEVIKI